MLPNGKKPDKARSAAQYAAVFQEEYGLDLLGDDEAVVTAALTRRAVRSELTAVLDDWASDTTVPSQRQRLERLADAMDPDPQGLAGRARRAARAKDLGELRRLLAVEARASSPPPAALIRLANAFWELSAKREALEFLREGQRRYPNDLRVNLRLGDSLITGTAMTDRPKRAAEAVEYYTAALALSPGSPSILNNLGIALEHLGRYKEALEAYRQAVAARPDSASLHVGLGGALDHLDRPGEAIAEYRRAIALDPTSNAPWHNLGVLHLQRNRSEEAIEAARKAIEVKPEADVYALLSKCLHTARRYAEAEAAAREAVRLDPQDFKGHFCLGIALTAQNPRHPVAAIAPLRKAVQLDPGNAMCHFSLGLALQGTGDVAGAAAAYREAIRVQPEHAEAHCNLANMLRLQGRFAEALSEVRIGHDLGSRKPGWHYPSAQWVKDYERFLAMDGELTAVLAGKAQPTDAREGAALAFHCLKYRQKTAAAARLFAEAFARGPELATRLNAHRYNAACAAALAGCGRGADAAKPSEPQRQKSRRQALAWLTAELAWWAERPGPDRPKVLREWQTDSDLAGVRDAAALAKLSAPERAKWQKLWAGVAALASQRQPSTAAPGR
jgi:tetratricopeptide (TPR) repeat protein